MLFRNCSKLCPLISRHLIISEKLLLNIERCVLPRICMKPLAQNFHSKRFMSGKILYDDNVEEGWKRVYVGPLATQIRIVKVGS